MLCTEIEEFGREADFSGKKIQFWRVLRLMCMGEAWEEPRFGLDRDKHKKKNKCNRME